MIYIVDIPEDGISFFRVEVGNKFFQDVSIFYCSAMISKDPREINPVEISLLIYLLLLCYY
jgi:hypothetical protein